VSTTPAGKPAARAYKPQGDDVVRFLQENAVFGMSKRFQQLDRFEAHYKGTQYEHQEFDWWGRRAAATETVSPEALVPEGWASVARDDLEARQKRPTAPRNLAKTIVKRFTGLLLSNQRRPRVVVENDSDTEAFLEAVREASKFWSAMRAARDLGGAVGSVCVTAHLRDGTFSYEVHNAKNVQVLWKDRRTWTPQGILVMYEYPVEEDVVDEKTRRVVGTREVSYLYRRIITDTVEIIYKAVRLEDAAEVGWEPEEGLSVEHGLGFFPGVWIQNTPDMESMDGNPDCDGTWQSMDTGDRLLSQMNMGTLNNLDPTAVLKYDDKQVATNGGLRKGSDFALHVGKDGDAKYMEISGTGIEIALKLLGTMRQDVLDITRCVLLDPDQISGSARSAKAIEYLYAPMTEATDDYRDQYGSAIVHLMRITEKIARAFVTKPMQLAPADDGTPRIGRPDFDLPLRTIKTPDGGQKTIPFALGEGGGYVQLEWGPYFAPSADDEGAEIKNAAAANQAGLIDAETAATKIAPIFSVRDVAGVVQRAKEEAQDRAALAMGDDLGAGVLDEGHQTDPREADGPAAGAGGKP
jgi:hypothetical protein